MKVWIVMEGEQNDSEWILEIFDSKQKAQDYCEEEGFNLDEFGHTYQYIDEWEVK